MVTKNDSVSLTLRGIANSVYWRFLTRNGVTDVEKEINGVKALFPVTNEIFGWTIWRHGGNMGGEYDVISDLLKNIKKEDVFWDVGANQGLYTAFSGQICDTTIAFEPNDEKRAYLKNIVQKMTYLCIFGQKR